MGEEELKATILDTHQRLHHGCEVINTTKCLLANKKYPEKDLNQVCALLCINTDEVFRLFNYRETLITQHKRLGYGK